VAMPLLKPPAQLQITSEEFNFFREKIEQLAGIFLSDAKRDLVQSRLRSRIQELGLEGIGHYKSHLETLPPSHQEWQVFVNLLTTNKTDWFREPSHFDFLVGSFLPAWLKIGKEHLKVWCGASSTGEEPYTLSLVLHKALRKHQIGYSILATDIDTKVLEVARNGVYSLERICQQVPEEYREEGFAQGNGEISSWAKVRSEIRSPVSFQQINLTKADFGNNGGFDLIFIRNVLIYFDKKTIEIVVENAFKNAAPSAALVIAHSESLQNISTQWKYSKPSIYVKGGLL